MAQMIKTRMVSVPRLESLTSTIGGLRGPMVVFSTQPEAKRHPIQYATPLNRRSLWLGVEAIEQARRLAMARYLFVGFLVLCFASPAFAAKRYYNRGASDLCKIVNIAPYYNRTTIRNGRRVYVTRSIDPVNMAIICKPEAAW
jgi:hypothetical protein